ncbi:metallophosphoesterase [Selenomonas ruminantium]|uniref:Serine/threonine protein phosphatase 1 n=1 Tax=Selenomonas ruminantium TaxID=971 RepID=A0A1H4A700_SELRU|nr:metallophosphoesterase [Selenomonas ruminantium]SEA31441.1 serine/threonine protein phosphatase 1 [Selenomonas ruminantium]
MDKIERLLVFGDIHGKWERFLNVYQKVGFNPEHDLMVFLGDYLDRGENPVPVMEWVLEHFGSKNMIFLRGNHEQMFYEALRDESLKDGLVDFRIESPKYLWGDNGGKETYRAMEETGRLKELTTTWMRLIEKMPLYAEVEAEGHKYWFVHADCNPEQPLENQRAKTLLWSRNLAKYPSLHQGEQIIVLGHTPVQALRLGSKPCWLSQGRLVLMDTGSFLENGHISCANLLTKEVWQSN